MTNTTNAPMRRSEKRVASQARNDISEQRAAASDQQASSDYRVAGSKRIADTWKHADRRALRCSLVANRCPLAARYSLVAVRCYLMTYPTPRTVEMSFLPRPASTFFRR